MWVGHDRAGRPSSIACGAFLQPKHSTTINHDRTSPMIPCNTVPGPPHDDRSPRYASDDPTTPRIAVDGTRLSLAVIGEGFVATHPLPARGAVTIGRGSEADIRIDHESVSRKHLRLHLG